MRPRPALTGLLLGAALGVIVALAFRVPFARGFENGPYDLLCRWFAEPEKGLTSRVKILIVTDPDMAAFEDPTLKYYPLRRDLYADIIAALKETQPKLGVMLLDLVFADPTPLVAQDRVLAEALKANDDVVLAMALFTPQPGNPAPPPTALPQSATVALYGDPALLPARPLAQPPAPLLAEAAYHLGNARIAPDEDGVIRRVAIASRHGDQIVPALPIAAAMALFGESSLNLAPDGRTLRAFASIDLPLDGDANLLLNYRGPRGTFPTAGLSQLFDAMNGEIELPWLHELQEGDVVIIGANVTGNPDAHATPTDETLPGPELVATAIDNVLRGDPLWRPPEWVLFAIPVLVGAAVGGLSVLGYRRRLAMIFAVPLVLAYIALVALLFDRGMVLDVVSPMSAAFFAYLGVAIQLYRTEGKKRREIRRTFSQYMSEEVVSDLEQNPDAVRLGGEKRVMTVLFSDIAGFTGVSERMTPEELVAFLNEYLTRMTDTILDCRGVIDKYQGDAIMAFWNAPIRREDHARLALLAAARFRENVLAFSAEKKALGLPGFDTRIGVNTGPMVVGNMGSTKRFDYTVIGDAVNLAARLESANKYFASTTMLTKDVLDAAGDGAAVVRPLAKLRVKGRAEPVPVFELLGAAGAGASGEPPWVKTFAAGLAHFQAGRFAEAEAAFRKCANERPGGDPVSERYVALCAEYAGVTDFDGVITLKEK